MNRYDFVKSSFLLLLSTLPLAAQLTLAPVRIGGLSPNEWPIGDGGPAVDALFIPAAIAWDHKGDLFIADSRNRRIRRVSADGVISTLVELNDRVSRPGESHPEPLLEPYLNLSAHTAPAMEPRRTPICQCAHNFGSRLEIRATQCVALRK